MTSYLSEDVEENTRLIRSVTELIMRWIPTVMKRSVAETKMSNIPGFDMLKTRYKDNELFEKNVQDLGNLGIFFYTNDEVAEQDDPHYTEIKKSMDSVHGYFLPGGERISIFYQEIQRTLKKIKQQKAIQSVTRKVVTHEVRHFFQYQTFPDYFTSGKAYVADYEIRPMEIDAVFYEILGTVNPFKFIERPSDYVKIVLDLLNQQRVLSPAQLKNYRKQAASYFTKHVDKNLQDEWSKAVKAASGRSRSMATPETFVGDVMDTLETYVQQMHFRKMKDSIYTFYRKKTMDYYRELTKGQRIEQRVNALYTRVYPVFVTHMREIIPSIVNSRINAAQVSRQVLDATRNEMQRRGIKTNSKIYLELEKKLQERVAEIVGNFRR